VTARAPRGPAVPDAVRTQRGPGPGSCESGSGPAAIVGSWRVGPGLVPLTDLIETEQASPLRVLHANRKPSRVHLFDGAGVQCEPS
jgi:hypothetical protein